MAEQRKQPPRISPERKAVYYAGLGMMALGILLCVAGFYRFASGGLSMAGFGATGGIPSGFGMFGLGMLLMAAGAVLRGIGARGAAGSGLVLDPEKAREDLHPFTHAAGGMVRDAVDAFRGDAPAAAKEVVKVRCPHCRALNDEGDKFCGQCGAQL